VGDTDPAPAVRKAVTDRLGRRSEAGIDEFLERRAASDPDPAVSLLALERLRAHRAEQLGRLFSKRLAAAHAASDAKSLETLVPLSQQWTSYTRGATLPDFMQEPPPVFAGIPPRQSVRVVAFSDFGQEGPNMAAVAAAANAYHRGKPFDFGITLGDNIVPSGVTGTADPRWKTIWEDLYGPLGVPIYGVTGNHDWGFASSPAAEIAYSQKSATWRMPALYYTFTAGPVQFFALATHALSEAQLQWLDRELNRSTARWKIVYGHHPIYSYAGHLDTPGFDKSLLPILKGRANAYIVGHEHVMQHIQPEGGVHFIVNGAGGQGVRPAVNGPRTVYAGSFYGFTVIEAGPDTLKLSFVDTTGKVRYETGLE
jgi:tartrate-resistant acid phosphatase type 5